MESNSQPTSATKEWHCFCWATEPRMLNIFSSQSIWVATTQPKPSSKNHSDVWVISSAYYQCHSHFSAIIEGCWSEYDRSNATRRVATRGKSSISPFYPAIFPHCIWVVFGNPDRPDPVNQKNHEFLGYPWVPFFQTNPCLSCSLKFGWGLDGCGRQHQLAPTLAISQRRSVFLRSNLWPADSTRCCPPVSSPHHLHLGEILSASQQPWINDFETTGVSENGDQSNGHCFMFNGFKKMGMGQYL